MRVTFGELIVDDLSSFNVDFAAFVNSRYVVSLEVLEFAAKKAIGNWERGKRISRSLPIEILLYYASTRQIKDALKIGIHEGKNRVGAVILDDRRVAELRFRELKFNPEYDFKAVKEFYGITDEEMEIAGVEKLPLLVRERIALFSAFEEVVK
ncbi:KEOPS complex subunit Cgi121 [Archaeoglobus neptunius]|uniref:KEOPS complex subunit Cgi121 n=1 Tax=Archaeoglobus neptunius TaxID=2798580 RepID=UPI00192887E2|nr:KEOPS complex subunit Cgi121 [Archaeoglobus neptunius]